LCITRYCLPYHASWCHAVMASYVVRQTNSPHCSRPPVSLASGHHVSVISSALPPASANQSVIVQRPVNPTDACSTFMIPSLSTVDINESNNNNINQTMSANQRGIWIFMACYTFILFAFICMLLCLWDFCMDLFVLLLDCGSFIQIWPQLTVHLLPMPLCQFLLVVRVLLVSFTGRKVRFK